MDKGKSGSAPGQTGQTGASSASGQQKQYTISKSDGSTQTLSQEQIRTQRAQLLADGWTGHGLDTDDTDTESGGSTPTPGGTTSGGTTSSGT